MQPTHCSREKTGHSLYRQTVAAVCCGPRQAAARAVITAHRRLSTSGAAKQRAAPRRAQAARGGEPGCVVIRKFMARRWRYTGFAKGWNPQTGDVCGAGRSGQSIPPGDRRQPYQTMPAGDPATVLSARSTLRQWDGSPVPNASAAATGRWPCLTGKEGGRVGAPLRCCCQAR